MATNCTAQESHATQIATVSPCGDELASWVDAVVKRNLVIGKPECLDDLKKRLDTVMAPLPDAASADAATPLPTALDSDA